jgi:putative peptidoglycan lipid II flippase
VTGPAAPVTEPGGTRSAARGIGGAAVLIGGLTVAARVVGLGRQLVFAHTVQAFCLGTAYTTANQVPNVIYDIVLGGALTSIMVPVLAGPAEKATADPAARAEVSRTSSALLCWTVIILVPVSVALAALSGPVAGLLIPATVPGCSHAALVSTATRMLAVFAPQILLYGLAVVLFGILQAYRRFTAPAVAPVLSSIVVITAYLVFVPLGGDHVRHLAGLPTDAELMLSVGTTAGVAALALTALVPVWRLRLRIRPGLRFPPGVARRAVALAAAGLAALTAQDISVLVVTRLANGQGGSGAVVLYGYGWQIFTAAYAVLAIPIAISAFPVLSARRGPEFDGTEFDATAAGAARAVLLASGAGAALLAGAAVPVARVFASTAGQVTPLAVALAAFAPGLLGYGLAACQTRVLFADGRNRTAAVIMSAGWLLVIAADVAAVLLVPARWVVPVLGGGNTLGLVVAGLAGLIAVRRARGPAAVAGTARAGLAALAGAVAGAVAAGTVSAVVPVSGVLLNVALASVAALVAVAGFAAVAFLIDRDDLGTVTARLLRRGRRP